MTRAALRMEDLGFGRRLQMARLKIGMGQATAAKELGVGRDTLSAWENAERAGRRNGDRYPDARNLMKICELYGIDPAWLLFGDTRPKLNGKPSARALRAVQTDASHRKTEPHARQLPLTVPVASPRN